MIIDKSNKLDKAFENNLTITSVTLPNQIERIGVRAFANCASLAAMSCSVD